jgi:hypothetical protein
LPWIGWLDFQSSGSMVFIHFVLLTKSSYIGYIQAHEPIIKYPADILAAKSL